LVAAFTALRVVQWLAGYDEIAAPVVPFSLLAVLGFVSDFGFRILLPPQLYRFETRQKADSR
jgi:hypothetical protein